jgi:protein-S-isoprenylcysteine O-methyltransferase Ste14
MINIIIFLLVSLIIVKISWPMLFNMRSHGFYRFFAFEFLLIGLIVNSGFWFHRPFSFSHTISWLMLAVAIFLAYTGFQSLRQHGHPTGNIETTTVLVAVGPYKYIRHPLYGSLIFLSIASFLKNPSLLATSIFFVATVFFYAAARVEEQENLLKFGEDYAVYIRRTKMFVPFLF